MAQTKSPSYSYAEAKKAIASSSPTEEESTLPLKLSIDLKYQVMAYANILKRTVNDVSGEMFRYFLSGLNPEQLKEVSEKKDELLTKAKARKKSETKGNGESKGKVEHESSPTAA